MITYDDFAKLDVRIGTIQSAEKMPNATKLTKLQVSFGDNQLETDKVGFNLQLKRQILAGIAEFYKPEELVGKQCPFLINLEPKKLKGEESQGMMLAVEGRNVPDTHFQSRNTTGNKGDCFLLHPNKGGPDGSKIV